MFFRFRRRGGKWFGNGPAGGGSVQAGSPSSNRQRDLPYCVIDLYLAAGLYARDPEGLRTRTVIPLLLANPDVTIARATQTLTIGRAEAATAARLHLDVGAPVAHVTRIFRRPDESVLYYAEVVYRGDAIHLDINLMP